MDTSLIEYIVKQLDIIREKLCAEYDGDYEQIAEAIYGHSSYDLDDFFIGIVLSEKYKDDVEEFVEEHKNKNSTKIIDQFIKDAGGIKKAIKLLSDRICE